MGDRKTILYSYIWSHVKFLWQNNFTKGIVSEVFFLNLSLQHTSSLDILLLPKIHIFSRQSLFNNLQNCEKICKARNNCVVQHSKIIEGRTFYFMFFCCSLNASICFCCNIISKESC